MRLPVSICGLHLDPIRRQCTMLLSKSGFLSLFLYSRPATRSQVMTQNLRSHHLLTQTAPRHCEARIVVSTKSNILIQHARGRYSLHPLHELPKLYLLWGPHGCQSALRGLLALHQVVWQELSSNIINNTSACSFAPKCSEPNQVLS